MGDLMKTMEHVFTGSWLCKSITESTHWSAHSPSGLYNRTSGLRLKIKIPKEWPNSNGTKISAVLESFFGDCSRLICRFRLHLRFYVRSVGKAVLIDSTQLDPIRLPERTVF